MEVCDTIVMFLKVFPDGHGVLMVAVEGSVNELHLFDIVV
jgi:hypothetical protein